MKFCISPFPFSGSACHLMSPNQTLPLQVTHLVSQDEGRLTCAPSFSHQVHLKWKWFCLFPKGSTYVQTQQTKWVERWLSLTGCCFSNFKVPMNHLGFHSSADSDAVGLDPGARVFVSNSSWCSWCSWRCWFSDHTRNRNSLNLDGIRTEGSIWPPISINYPQQITSFPSLKSFGLF